MSNDSHYSGFGEGCGCALMILALGIATALPSIIELIKLWIEKR